VKNYILLTDLELIEEVKNGDQNSFREIVKRYEQTIANIITSMLGKSADAEDVGQEVFIRFYQAIHQFKGESKLGTYLTRIAINLSLNELKKRKRKNFWYSFSDVSDKNFNQIADAENQRDKFTEKELVNKGLQMLKPDYRIVVTLRYIEGYSTKETADILNIPQGTVLSRLSRGQEKLKNILGKLNILEE